MAEGDLEDFYSMYYMILGSVLIAASSGYGLIAGFQGDFSTVYLGLIGFVSGYKIAQIGLHNGRESANILVEYMERLRSYGKVDAVSFIGGSMMLTLGFMTLTQSIVEIKITLAAASAVSMGAGYMVGHWAINNTLV